MNKRCTEKFNEIDEELRALFESLKYFSDAQLNRSPSDGKWSILQNMHHLLLGEGFAHQYLTKKLSFNPEFKKSGIGNWFRSRALGFYMKTGIKRKAPEQVNTDLLPSDTKFWETVKKWKEQRMQLKQFLEGLDPDLFNKQVYKHPFVGKLSLYQMLQFFQLHFRRHKKAIDKISNKLPRQND